jgi:hypothetical protein
MFRGTNPKDVNLRKNKVRKLGTIQRRYRDRGSRASEWVSGIVSTGLDACSELARPPWRAFFCSGTCLPHPDWFSGDGTDQFSGTYYARIVSCTVEGGLKPEARGAAVDRQFDPGR